MGMLLVFLLVDQVSPFERTNQGVLTALLPRALLYLLWAGETLAVVMGVGSFLLIRQTDRLGQRVLGIAVRSLVGTIVGLISGLILWLVVGHVVIGF